GAERGERREVAALVAFAVEREQRALEVAERAADLELAADLFFAAVAGDLERDRAAGDAALEHGDRGERADGGARGDGGEIDRARPAPRRGRAGGARAVGALVAAYHRQPVGEVGFVDGVEAHQRARGVVVGVERAAQRRVGRAAPRAIVVLAVAAARRGVDRVDQSAGVALEQFAARGGDRRRRARVLAAGAGVDLAVL